MKIAGYENGSKTVTRIVAYETNPDGQTSIADIIEFDTPYTPKGSLTAGFGNHLVRLINSDRVSKIEIIQQRRDA